MGEFDQYEIGLMEHIRYLKIEAAEAEIKLAKHQGRYKPDASFSSTGYLDERGSYVITLLVEPEAAYHSRVYGKKD